MSRQQQTAGEASIPNRGMGVDIKRRTKLILTLTACLAMGTVLLALRRFRSPSQQHPPASHQSRVSGARLIAAELIDGNGNTSGPVIGETLVSKAADGKVLTKQAGEGLSWTDLAWDGTSSDVYVIRARGNAGEYYPEDIYRFGASSKEGEWQESVVLNYSTLVARLGNEARVDNILQTSQDGRRILIQTSRLDFE